MKLKKIKPYMIIHCPKEADAIVLLLHLASMGYEWTTHEKLENCTNYDDYEEKTCYYIKPDKLVEYAYYDFYKINDIYGEIIEFSDLIKSELKFNVGDKVKIRKDLYTNGKYGNIVFVSNMKDWKGTIATIKEVYSDFYRIEEDDGMWKWTDEMFEHENTTEMTLDKAIAHCEEKSDCTACGREHAQLAEWLKELREIKENSTSKENSTEMSAVEVLEWLSDYAQFGSNNKKLSEIFDVTTLEALLTWFTADEIIQKITAYETAKRVHKPVKKEIGHMCIIFDESHRIVMKRELWLVTEQEAKNFAQRWLDDYTEEHKGLYTVSVEYMAQQKDNK